MISSINSSSYAHYTSMINNRKQMEEAAFNKTDSNQDGSLDITEFSTVLDKISERTGLSINAEETFANADQDGDGAISKEDFSTFRAENAPPPPPPHMMGEMMGAGTGMGLASVLFPDEESSSDSILNMISSLTQQYLDDSTSSNEEGETSTKLQESLLKMKNAISQYTSLMSSDAINSSSILGNTI